MRKGRVAFARVEGKEAHRAQPKREVEDLGIFVYASVGDTALVELHVATVARLSRPDHLPDRVP